MRLIDADALNKALGFADPCANCEHVYGMFLCADAIWQEVCDEIYEAPTIDAVPVVRCKDCKYRKVHEYHYKDIGYRSTDCTRGNEGVIETYGDSGYCSLAERKEAEDATD